MKAKIAVFLIVFVLGGIQSSQAEASALFFCVHEHAVDLPEVPYSLRELLVDEAQCDAVVSAFESMELDEQVFFVNLYGGIDMDYCVNISVTFTYLLSHSSDPGKVFQSGSIWSEILDVPCDSWGTMY